MELSSIAKPLAFLLSQGYVERTQVRSEVLEFACSDQNEHFALQLHQVCKSDGVERDALGLCEEFSAGTTLKVCLRTVRFDKSSLTVRLIIGSLDIFLGPLASHEALREGLPGEDRYTGLVVRVESLTLRVHKSCSRPDRSGRLSQTGLGGIGHRSSETTGLRVSNSLFEALEAPIGYTPGANLALLDETAHGVHDLLNRNGRVIAV
mmetsp:Transcript_12964/g.24806  ORF Transcript_12964/g.24806 Transcript_12964/m.24806 type:complete len:207 (+) Transcript_12964:530-1150(+)